MKIKTQDLIGVQLDWAVAKCEDVDEEAFRLYYTPTESSDLDTHGYPEFHYSTIWAQGGPIIEQEKMDCHAPSIQVQYWTYFYSVPQVGACAKKAHRQTGPTPLIAAMRCFVASKLGNEVEVPEGLQP